LHHSGYIHDPAAFRSVVIDCALNPFGMASCADVVTPAQAEGICTYLDSASRTLNEQQTARLPER
jgi:hypothetical protein